MSDEALSPTELELIKRAGKACLITFAFIVLAMKQSYFDYPVMALSFVIFAISLLNSTAIFARVAVGYMLVLVIVPPQSAPIFKESISFLISLMHS
jgi:hypothetical protein